MAAKKIILDADVIIHFGKAGLLNILPQIFDDLKYIILDKVYNELKGEIKTQVDNQMLFLGNISIIPFDPKGEQRKEYAMLLDSYGTGESACMAYCKYNNDIIGSSNLRDIAEYCKAHNIIYLTTLDFLYYALKKSIITTKDANDFIADVRSKGSKLPDIDIREYSCNVTI